MKKWVRESLTLFSILKMLIHFIKLTIPVISSKSKNASF